MKYIGFQVLDEPILYGRISKNKRLTHYRTYAVVLTELGLFPTNFAGDVVTGFFALFGETCADMRPDDMCDGHDLPVAAGS